MTRRDATTLVLLVLALPVAIYASGYVWARATHRLVFYSSGFVARPHATRGIGFTTWELVFAPLAWAEGVVRR